MTVTVKLDRTLEARLRLRASRSGLTTSEVIRAALTAYLDTPELAPPLSAYALGAGLFGRHAGEPGLASNRRKAAAEAWSERHAARGEP